MATTNAISNKTGTLTVDNALTVTAGGATVTAGDVTVTAGNVILPVTNALATEGAVTIGSKNALNMRGTDNIFMGEASGSGASFSGSRCLGIGKNTLKSLNTGNQDCVAIGSYAMQAATTARDFVAVGSGAGGNATSGGWNSVLIGASSGNLINTGGNKSVAIGYQTQVGATGDNNISIGYQAGKLLFHAESSNICIANAGVNGESNKMRLGTDGTGDGQVDTVYLAGTNAHISTAATAGTVNIATGAAAKTVTLGSTSGASSLALKTGTGDFSIASATGTVMNILNTGEVTKPLQPMFLAYSNATQSNVTGDGTYVTIAMNTEIKDQNADFNTGTYTFTAPCTGSFLFSASVHHQGIAAGMTGGYLLFVTSNRTYFAQTCNPVNLAYGSALTLSAAVQADMDAGDTCYVQTFISGGAKTVGIYGAANGEYTNFAGHLIC